MGCLCPMNLEKQPETSDESRDDAEAKAEPSST